jgi:hypothetical protein
MPGSGWCTHPKRKLNSNVKVLVRKGELACRNSWGESLWVDALESGSTDELDDTLVAGPSTNPTAKPGQLWLPDAASGNEPNTMKQPQEDISENQAAHREQEDRAQFMRLSPRDAITRAWARSSERKLGNQPVHGESVIAGTGDDEDVAQPIVEPEESNDREIQRRVSPPSVPKTTSEERDRLVTPHVPVADVTSRPNHDDEGKFNDIPEIQPDVELPRLRNQFSVPRHRASTSTFSSRPARSNVRDDSGESAISPYELALQRAREFRASAAPSTSESSLDRVTSTFTQHNSTRPAPEPEGEDELVDFQAERTTVGSRFAAPVDYIDDIHDDSLEEDFELDRSFRPEETATQSGHRWWHTFARHRVFRQPPERDSGEDHIAFAALNYDTDPFPVTESANDHFAINWDNASLAPVVPARRERPADSVSTQTWASLDYLDDVESDDEPLAPIAWQVPEVAERVEESRVAGFVPNGHRFDPYSREGMDHLRDRLFASSFEAQTQPESSQQPTASRPFTRTIVSRPPADIRVENSRNNPDRTPTPGQEYRAETREEKSADIEFDYDSEFNPDYDLRRIVATKSDPPLDMTIMISPEIPRKCATCRSFRAAENGSRGWCTNKWAFAHRPLVDSEDLACEATIGCWWLPQDIEWNREKFIAEISAPTPRSDRLIAAQDGERRRMTS